MTHAITVFYDHEKVKHDLETYHPDISIDLMRQPGLFSYYSTLQAKAEAQHDRLKHTRDLVEARLEKKARKALMDESPDKKRVTEAEVRAVVVEDEGLRKVESLLRQAKEQVSLMIGVTSAFRQRRDSLMQLAFLMREESKGEPRVMNRAAAANGASRRENFKERAAALTSAASGVDAEIEIDP
jgi:hypothetical protein